MDFFNPLKKQISVYKQDVFLSNYNTFGIGGRCKMLVFPTSVYEICKTVDFCVKNDVSYKIIGNGSNLLVGDEGYDGIIIRLDSRFSQVEAKENHVFAEAGASAKKVYNYCLQNSLGGFEFLATLPATIGGISVMNAGCFGQEAKDIINRVWATDGHNVFEFDVSQLNYGYRTSILSNSNLLVTKVEFVLKKQDRQKTERNFCNLMSQKQKLQPLKQKSAGCIFKKVNGVSAGYYIDKCGLKGFCIGDAQISRIHAGFIVNNGRATCKDVLSLVDVIYTKCKKTFGIELVPEVNFLGSTDDFSRLSYTYGIQPR